MQSHIHKIMITLCVTAVFGTLYTAEWFSWLGFGKKAPVVATALDRELLQAVKANNMAGVTAALTKQANPNISIDGEPSAFIQAFEHAFRRNEDGQIVSLSGHERIAIEIARSGGNLEELQRYVKDKYMVDGGERRELFKPGLIRGQNIAYRVFVDFVNKLAVEQSNAVQRYINEQQERLEKGDRSGGDSFLDELLGLGGGQR